MLLHPGYVRTDMTSWEGNIDTQTCVKGEGAGRGAGVCGMPGPLLRRHAALPGCATCSFCVCHAEQRWTTSVSSATLCALPGAGLLAVLESDRQLNGKWYAFDGKEVPW